MSAECEYLQIGTALDIAAEEKIRRRARIAFMLDGVHQDDFTGSSRSVADHNKRVINDAVHTLRQVVRSKAAAGVQADADLYDILIALEGLWKTMGDPAHFLFTEAEQQAALAIINPPAGNA